MLGHPHPCYRLICKACKNKTSSVHHLNSTLVPETWDKTCSIQNSTSCTDIGSHKMILINNNDDDFNNKKYIITQKSQINLYSNITQYFIHIVCI